MPRGFAELSYGSLGSAGGEPSLQGEDNDFGLEQGESEELVGRPCGV